jgi:hypothetical protein
MAGHCLFLEDAIPDICKARLKELWSLEYTDIGEVLFMCLACCINVIGDHCCMFDYSCTNVIPGHVLQ